MKDLDRLSKYSQDYLLLRMLVSFGNKIGTVERMVFNELTGRQAALLASINDFDGIPTLGDLAEHAGSSHQNIKQMSLKLQGKEYVKMLADARDARKTRVEITAKGKRYCRAHYKREAVFMEQLFSEVITTDAQTATEIVRALNKNLDEMVERGLKLK